MFLSTAAPPSALFPLLFRTFSSMHQPAFTTRSSSWHVPTSGFQPFRFSFAPCSAMLRACFKWLVLTPPFEGMGSSCRPRNGVPSASFGIRPHHILISCFDYQTRELHVQEYLAGLDNE